MKTNILKTVITVIFSFWIITVFGQEKFTKNYKKSFSVNENTIFILSNKYGKVHVETNQSDKVEIKVSIIADVKSEEKANEIFKNIKINFSETANTISAVTEIEGSIKNTNINYFVTMPETLNSKLSNKYGYMFIDKLKSSSEINCKYGTLQINELLTLNKEKPALIDLKYSEGNIELSDFLTVDVKYSELDIKESAELSIVSGYSKLNLTKAGLIKAVSKYDPHYIVKDVSLMFIEGKYSKYEIENLKKTLKAKISYSNIELSNIEKNFDNVFIISKYGNIELSPDKEASYKLSAKVEYGNILCNCKVFQKDIGLKKLVSVFLGKDETSKSKIAVLAEYGNLKVN
jgi:hypothetical protein